MSKYLSVLESAISDIGCWTWWTSNLPDSFQVEFGGTQLWNPPNADGQPPSNQIALRFRKPRLIYFLTFTDGIPGDWPDRLQRDELNPPGVDHEVFTLTDTELCGRLIEKALAVRAVIGEPGRSSLPVADEAFLGFEAGDFGFVVAAESLGFRL